MSHNFYSTGLNEYKPAIKLSNWIEDSTLPYMNHREFIKLIKKGQIAAILKSGLNYWYCFYENKEDYCDKILLLEPKCWRGTSFPNEFLKESCKGLIYSFRNDHTSAIKYYYEYCQIQSGYLMNNLEDSIFSFRITYLNDIILCADGGKHKFENVITGTLSKADKFLEQINNDMSEIINLYPGQTKKQREEEIQNVFEKRRENDGTTFTEYLKEMEERKKDIENIRDEVSKYMRDSKNIQDLFYINVKKDRPHIKCFKETENECWVIHTANFIKIAMKDKYFNIEHLFDEPQKMNDNKKNGKNDEKKNKRNVKKTKSADKTEKEKRSKIILIDGPDSSNQLYKRLDNDYSRNKFDN